MNNLMCCLILSILLAAGCTTHGPFYVDNPFGAPVGYGEGRHPGIDFDIKRGIPIIAVSDGEVIYIGDPCIGRAIKWSSCGGIMVSIRHADHFQSHYGHLSKVFINKGQLLKRGQLIGLSGATNAGDEHLHFGICTIEGSCINYSQTYNPKKFYLGGKGQCFDPNMDYSGYSKQEITLPIACGEYAKMLIAETKK